MRDIFFVCVTLGKVRLYKVLGSPAGLLDKRLIQTFNCLTMGTLT